MSLPKETYNNDFTAGVKCPSCRSRHRNTVAHPEDDNADYKCQDCGHTWDEDSECGTTVVVGLPDSQPDMVRDGVISVHVDHGFVLDAELAEETIYDVGETVNVVRLVYAHGSDGRIAGKHAHIKHVGPTE